MLSPNSLQEYLRFQARQHHQAVPVDSFTFFLHTTDSSEEANYAIPDASGDSNDWSDKLRKLQHCFSEYTRKPCLQFVAEAFPHLSSALLSSGWSQVKQSQIMICTSETYRPARIVPGLEMTTLSLVSSVQEICEGLDTNALGFDPQAERATVQDAEAFRQDLSRSPAFTAYLQQQPVAAGMFTAIHQGVTELVGITTVAQFRQQGIATALTAYMTQVAFSQGATLVFLIAANEQAGRVYERVGFRPYARWERYTLVV
ncbi:hypothetical protein KDW_25920 [Dictyobacter vulcani]|uniref:N-acetyltransferase domain-containing protein n=1 Tax=Dictyobacter vulcani TaxID=2607529 RepID=A0A5J4KPU1_9CHLR|nr:GNAT family N-acetyltransferase [Dictyobacter vulcani]GER88430.1 hypothetical protein KDW_25920 [Dictyobacter vulcani]